MIQLVRRYRTNLVTCVREWFWVANTHAPEVVRGIIACTRAGALALPLLPALPMVPPVWAALRVPYPAIYGTAPYLDALPGGFGGGFGDIAGGAGMVSEFARGRFVAAPFYELGGDRFQGRVDAIPQTARLDHAQAPGGSPAPTLPAVSLPQFDTSLAPRPPGQTPPTTTVTIPEIVVRPDAPQDVPEPGASWALLGIGLVAVGLVNRSGRR